MRVNDFMCAYSGYSREELLATNPLDLLDEDSQRRFRERIGRALAGEQLEQSVEYRFVGKHGEERRVALSLTPTFDGGKPVRAFVVAYDITERSRLLEQANTTNQRLNDLLSSMADGFVSVDRTWRYTLVNPRAEELIGRPAQELLGHSMEVLFPEMEGWPHYRRVMADRVPETFEVWSRPLETWLEVHASPAGDGISILFADITERRCTEEALRTSEGRLATVLENSRDGINMLDLASGRYVFMNEAQVALTGFTMEEINGISAEEAHQRVHPDDRRLSIEQQSRVAAGEDVDEPVEYRWRVKSGAYRWFSDRRKLVRDEHGKPVALVGISRDITGRKTAEEALRRSEEQNRLERRRLGIN